MLTALTNAIVAGIQAGIPSLPTCAAYPQIKKQIQLPAVFVELAEMAADVDVGTEQLCVTTRWEARIIYDEINNFNTTYDGQLEVRNLAAQVALEIYKGNRFGVAVEPAKITHIMKDEFRPDLSGYLVWLVGWTHIIRLGDSIWDGTPGTIPSELYLAWGPGYGAQEDYGIVPAPEPPPWEPPVTEPVWTSRVSAGDYSWWDVAYGNNIFVAVASYAAGNGVMTSPDGVNWQLRPTIDNQWVSITFGNGLFVAIQNDIGIDRLMTSPDGIVWTSRDAPSDTDWFALTFGNGIFVSATTAAVSNGVMTSPDAVTWTLQTCPAIGWNRMTYGNGLFVAVNTDNVMTSPDAVTWTLQTCPLEGWRGIAYGNGVFVAISWDGPGHVMTSIDGVSWTLGSVPPTDNYWINLAFGNGLFVAIAGGNGVGDRVMTSPDGIVWSIGVSAADNSWRGICYGVDKFVAVSSSGVGNRVMTGE